MELDSAYKKIFSSKNLHENLNKINGEYKENDLVKEVIGQTSANSLSDMGKVMSLIMQKSNGRVDGKIANRLVKELLQ